LATEEIITLPPKLKQVFSGEARYRGAYGGRGSGKSHSFAKMLAYFGCQHKTKILCARELQISIKDSVHSEIQDAIESTPFLNERYECGQSFIRADNGTEFIFKGLRHNSREIKSTAGIGICWVEEAEAVSEKSWVDLIPTIRLPGSEIWMTWNPESTEAPVQKRFIDNQDDSMRIISLNYQDNPWFPAVLEEERKRDLRLNPDLYAHIWDGECITRHDAQVLNEKWHVENFTPGKDWDGPYFGCDWGFAVDPTVLIKAWIYENRLYVEYEAYGAKVEIDKTPALFDTIPESRIHVIRADSARPETISYMQRQGFNIIGAIKGKGSVEDGVATLRSFDKIVIHERCPETAKEARLWSYKVDRLTGDVLPVLVDAFNHAMDSIRYSLEPYTRGRNAMPATRSFGRRRF
jgi:phage terminase large subunit